MVTRLGVIIVGHTNFPSMVPSDASAFYAQNLFNLLGIMVDTDDEGLSLKVLEEDEITLGALVKPAAA